MRRLKYRLIRRQRDLARTKPDAAVDSSHAKPSNLADAAQRSAALSDMRGGVDASAEIQSQKTSPEGLR